MWGVVHEYACGIYNSNYYVETDRDLKVKFGEHIGILPLVFKNLNQQRGMQFATIF